MLDNRNHVDVSIKEKLNILNKPSNLIKLVLVQQQEVEKIYAKNRLNKGEDVAYIEQLYEHYIVQGKGKTYLNT